MGNKKNRLIAQTVFEFIMFGYLHIKFSSPEGEYENDVDVDLKMSYFFFLSFDVTNVCKSFLQFQIQIVND